jgi:hypothetical protein
LKNANDLAELADVNPAHFVGESLDRRICFTAMGYDNERKSGAFCLGGKYQRKSSIAGN